MCRWTLTLTHRLCHHYSLRPFTSNVVRCTRTSAECDLKGEDARQKADSTDTTATPCRKQTTPCLAQQVTDQLAMSDLRVNTRAIEDTYFTRPDLKELWNVTPVWHPKVKDARVSTFADAGKAKRLINGVIRIFEAKTMEQHRDAVEMFEHDLLWDGPPIRISNKGHLRLASYLFKYFAHISITPTAVVTSEPRPGKHLVEVDCVAVSYPHRVWWVPASLLLPSEVAKNVHFKIGVNGSLDDGKVELLTGRLSNFPPFFFTYFRTFMGILMGAIPHAFETPLGYLFDFADKGDYYARKRDAAFKARHPVSSNPTWDWIQDMVYDIPNWGKEQAMIGAESAQAMFGNTFDTINHILQQVINFYMWLFNTIWENVSKLTNAALDVIGGKEGAAPFTTTAAGQGAPGTAQAPGGNVITAGGGTKYYKGPAPAAATGTARPIAASG